MDNLSLKKRFSDNASKWFIGFIIFYAVMDIAVIFFNLPAPIVDVTAAFLLLTSLFLLHLKFRFKRTVPIAAALSLFIHIIGLIKLFPSATWDGALYGAPQLNYHYDWIAHSVGLGLYAIAACSIFYLHLRKAFKNYFIIFLILLLSMMGISAIHEAVEFLGYQTLGYGEGFLEFGAGDGLYTGGPWYNSSTDIISNFIGGVFFIGLFVLTKKYKKIKSKD